MAVIAVVTTIACACGGAGDITRGAYWDRCVGQIFIDTRTMARAVVGAHLRRRNAYALPA